MKTHDMPRAEHCIFCGSEHHLPWYPTEDIFGHSFVLKQCQACTAVFLSPRPDAAMLAQAYDSSYYGEQEEKFSNPLIERVLDYFRSGRARRLSRYLSPNARVLDLGCGNGRFLSYLRRFGSYELHGIELPGASAERARRIPGLRLKTGKLEAGDFELHSLDAISLFHVFEHLDEPVKVLDLIFPALKPGGILMMSFPNIDSWQSRFYKGKWLHLDPPRHLFFFKPSDFIPMMEKRGFRLLKTSWMSLEQNPYGGVQSSLNRMLQKREVLFERLKGNTAYAPEYGKWSILLQKIYFLCSFPVFVAADFVAGLFKKGATVEFIFKKNI